MFAFVRLFLCVCIYNVCVFHFFHIMFLLLIINQSSSTTTTLTSIYLYNNIPIKIYNLFTIKVQFSI